MRFAKGWIWAIIFGAALLALIGWRVVTKTQSDATMTKGGGASRRPPSVDVATVKSAEIINTISVVGDIESPQSVDITPKVTGRIEALEVREGDAVRAGQVLVRIDPSDLNQQVLAMQANVAEAKSRLAQAQLTQGSANVGVQSQVQQQQAAVTSAQAEYDQVKENYAAQVQRAQADVADNTAKVNAARVQVKNAEAQFALQQSNLKNLRAKYDRMQTLFTQGAVSQQTRDDARTAVEVQEQNANVAQGQIATAEANVLSAEASLSSAKDQLGIVKKQGIANIAAANAKLDQAKASLRSAVANKSQTPALEANIDALRSGVASAQAQYDAAKVRLQDTVLRSPIDGIVTSRTADLGDSSSSGRPILTVQALDWVYVTTSVAMEEAAGVREGMNAQVTIDSLPGEVFTGPITNLNPSADVLSRQFGVRIRLQNPSKVLRPGMYARVAIVTKSMHADVSVPIEAINKRDKESSVSVVDKDGIAHTVQVRTGASDGKTVQVLSGLKSGDKVITLSYSPVKDGQEVALPETGDKKGSEGKSGQGGSSKGGSSKGGN